jgi:diguanylate cyclase (GGDEF)-like protein
MKYVLIVEDSKITAHALKSLITENMSELIPIVKTTEAEAKEFINKHQKNIFMALLDLNLPDTISEGHIVDYALSKNIRSIVLTANTSDKVRKNFLVRKEIVDYVIKDSLKNIEYVIKLLGWIYENSKNNQQALLVEDSKVQRHIVKNILNNLCIDTFEAEDGEEAFEILKSNGNIDLVVVDLNIPKMDGVELTLKTRQEIKRDIVIIGITAETNGIQVAKFLKYGANDYLKKPFINEDFINRIHKDMQYLKQTVKLKQQMLELKEQRELTSNLTSTDYLTKIFNRLKFSKTFKFQHQKASSLALMLFDIDDFNSINESFGHSVGDNILVELVDFISSQLNENFKEDEFIFARWGGEEFVILFIEKNFGDIKYFSKKLLNTISKNNFENVDRVSLGASLIDVDKNSTMDENFKVAYKLLKEAKIKGSNQILFS